MDEHCVYMHNLLPVDHLFMLFEQQMHNILPVDHLFMQKGGVFHTLIAHYPGLQILLTTNLT